MVTENREYFNFAVRSKALLQCGHWVKVRAQPHPTAKLGCTAGLGCGYSFHWEKYQDEKGNIKPNRWLEKK